MPGEGRKGFLNHHLGEAYLTDGKNVYHCKNVFLPLPLICKSLTLKKQMIELN